MDEEQLEQVDVKLQAFHENLRGIPEEARSPPQEPETIDELPTVNPDERAGSRRHSVLTTWDAWEKPKPGDLPGSVK